MSIESAIQRLTEAEKTGNCCPPIRDCISEGQLNEAYKIQHEITAQKVSEGEVKIGKKIGLTSHAVQKQLGVDQPDFGVLWASKKVPNGGSLPHQSVMQPKVEAEIAFMVDKTIDKKIQDPEELMEYISRGCLAIEIAGSRIENWDITIIDTIADNASASHFVLSENWVDINDFDMMECAMIMKQNGAVVSEGKGAACLGTPFNAVQWLANKMLEVGDPLSKGEIVLSGALGPMVNGQIGDTFEAEIEGLGSASFTFDK